MKKIIYILSFIIISVGNTYSQKDTIRDNYIGINGGVTMYAIVTENKFEYEDFFKTNNEQIISSLYQNAWTAGIAYKNFSEKSVGTALELNYEKKGGYNVFLYDLDENTEDSTAVLFKHDLEYVEFTFMMNLRFGKKKLKFNLYGGPYISYLFKEKITFLSETSGIQYKTRADSKFDFGVNGGGGISYQFGKNIVELGVRISQGLINIFEYQSINSALLNQNQVISARFHYYYIF
ncbi:MAG: PorT family protein [Bacteroidales bacterium]|nr:PorT family protein [Bacteroidales bacterium]